MGKTIVENHLCATLGSGPINLNKSHKALKQGWPADTHERGNNTDSMWAIFNFSDFGIDCHEYYSNTWLGEPKGSGATDQGTARINLNAFIRVT